MRISPDDFQNGDENDIINVEDTLEVANIISAQSYGSYQSTYHSILVEMKC